MVGFMAFLQSSLNGATIRFLNIEMGKNNLRKLRVVFTNALFIYVCLAIVVLLLAETIGLWYISNKLNVSPARHNAALIVYQLSVLSTIVGILQTPQR
jgi:O-antigen/teichoic acid export membrane protein